jgi:lysophospholipase L1-like esterase
MSTNRRTFIKTASIGSLLAVNLPEITLPSSRRIALSDNDVILFQGDSITDAHRKRDDNNPNSPAALGSGYAFLAAADLLERNPQKNLRIFNKGISGNKVYQLADRWQTDCLELKPTVLSILVGVNDFWHTLVNGYTGTIKTYRDDYKALLDRTKQQLPDVKLIIGEPYAVKGVKAVDDKWYPAFDEYRQAAREIAESFGAAFIPYQQIYDKAQKSAPGSYWTPDGVHPSLAGARLMAEAWLQTVKG